MLILSRGIGKAIAIGDGIIVTMLSVKGHEVRIGVNAPHDINVCNEEIFLASQTTKSRKSERSDDSTTGESIDLSLGIPCKPFKVSSRQ